MSAKDKPQRTDRCLAFQIYCELGAERSHRQLLRTITEQGFHPPSSQSIKRWSSADHWVDRAHEYDLQVNAAVAREAFKSKILDRLDAATACRRVGHEVLQKAQEALPKIKVETVTDFKILAEAAITLFREADALEGSKPFREADDQHLRTQAEPGRNVSESLELLRKMTSGELPN